MFVALWKKTKILVFHLHYLINKKTVSYVHCIENIFDELNWKVLELLNNQY